MRIKETIEKVPGGLMIVPLMLGALINTVDKAHFPPVQRLLEALNAQPLGEPPNQYYEFLRIGGFTSALAQKGVLPFIALFLFCAGAQMNLRIGGRAVKKGAIITLSKFLMALVMGAFFGWLWEDPFSGFLGLSVLAVVAAMENSNGGLYVALTSEYGNHSDVGAVAILSLNDGPLFTMIILWMLGAAGIIQGGFPFIAFLAVLLPIIIGMILGNIDHSIRTFLKPGEQLLIPFFAFSLGTLMDLRVFADGSVVWGGLFLGVMTTLLTGLAGMAALKMFRERSVIAGAAEASTAGNATATPAAVVAAAVIAHGAGLMDAETLAGYTNALSAATAQVSIATLTTALMCPVMVICVARMQARRGIDGRVD